MTECTVGLGVLPQSTESAESTEPECVYASARRPRAFYEELEEEEEVEIGSHA